MSDTANPVPPPVEPKGKWWETPFWKKVTRVLTVVAGVLAAVAGAAKLYSAFSPSMPSCSASETGDVIRNIFKDKKLELTKLSDMTTIKSSSSEEDCQAHIETTAETGTIGYHVSLDGRQFLVRITNVDAKPR